MRIPRDVNGQLLADRLRRHGYVLTASSSTSPFQPTKPLRVGTLRQILKDVARQLDCSIEEVIRSLDF